MQRLQFDLGEQISRKEYLRRKRKNSRLLRKRSKITYILLAIFIALAIYIVIQLVIYRRYNNFKYTSIDDVNNQSIYNILYVTEGYTYDPVYSLSSILSSGDEDKSILPSSNLREISVTEESYYGIRDGVLCKINRENNEVTELINDNVQKYVVATKGYIAYTSGNNERLKVYNVENGETKKTDLAHVKQVFTDNKSFFCVTHSSDDKSVYSFWLNGEAKKKISGDAYATTAVVGESGRVYFIDKNDDNKIYGVNADGSELWKVADISSVSKTVDEVNSKKYMFERNNILYYVNSKDENTLWAYNIDTKENVRVISSPVELLQNVDNTIFYKIEKEMGVYLYNTDTKFLSLVTKRRVREFVIDPFVDIKLVVD